MLSKDDMSHSALFYRVRANTTYETKNSIQSIQCTHISYQYNSKRET